MASASEIPPSASSSSTSLLTASSATSVAVIPPVDLDYIFSHMMTIGRPKTGISTCITEQDISELLLNVKALFMEQPMMLELEPPVTICGDIHGQFNDLMRIFDKCGFPNETNYLFLGDYVDRGKMNLEVIIFLFACKLRYPKNFFLLRGNHETQLVNRIYGFYEEIVRRYVSTRLYALFQDVFNTMPLSALVGDRILCMHGGLSPDMLKAENLNILREIYRPLHDPPNPSLPLDLLWADPDQYTNEFKYNDRGVSLTFGINVVNKVCEKFNLDLICRAHQVVQDGYEFFANRKLVTIFSAPHYCGVFDNAAAVMQVDKQMQCSFKILRPLFPKMKKSDFDARKDVTCYGPPKV